MRNTKEKARIQSINNDNLNLQAKIEGKCNASGCRHVNNNELYGKSITIENEMQHVGLNRKFKPPPKLSIDILVYVIQREDIPPYSRDALHVAT